MADDNPFFTSPQVRFTDEQFAAFKKADHEGQTEILRKIVESRGQERNPTRELLSKLAEAVADEIIKDSRRQRLSDLIEALQIILKYGDHYNPTNCGLDVLMVMVSPDIVSEEDQAQLEVLGFEPNSLLGVFQSTRFGSA